MKEEITNEMIDYASKQFSTPTEEPPVNTEIVEPVTSSTEQPPVESTEIVQNTSTIEAPTQQITEQIDYGKIFDEISGGLFKDVDSFKAALPKFQDYDSLQSKALQLEEKSKENPFANDFTKVLNEMVKSGKSNSEIDAFIKLGMTDVKSLSPTEVLVMDLVNQGYDKAIAKEMVEDDYPINDHEEGSRERRHLEEKLRVESEGKRRGLEDLKKDLFTIDNTAQQQAKEQQEQAELTRIANQKQHENTVKSTVPTITETFTGLGKLILNSSDVKDGKDAIEMSFDFDDQYKSAVSEGLERFFIDGEMPVNDENIDLAKKYIRADYLEKNIGKIAEDIYKTAHALGFEAAQKKYENRTGVPPETPPEFVQDDIAKQQHDFLQKIAGRN